MTRHATSLVGLLGAMSLSGVEHPRVGWFFFRREDVVPDVDRRLDDGAGHSVHGRRGGLCEIRAL